MSETITQERKVVTAIPGPKSQELMERRNEVVSTGIGTALPVFIESAEGAILKDVDGNQFIDFGSGIGVTTLGHRNERVVTYAKNQLDKFLHTLITVTPYEGYVKVAEHLAKHVPISGPVKTMLINSGSEAVENGVKIARKYTGRPGVAVLDYSYHGRTLLTSSMTHKAVPYAAGFGPRASSIFRAPNSYPLHDGLSGEEAAKRTITYLEKVVGVEDLACVVVEPIQGEGGFVVPADGYLKRVVQWCKDNGVVFIADEVQSGITRTGKLYASEHFDYEPDIILTAKGIADGMPIAAITGRKEIMDCTGPGTLGGTFGGNPVSCAAAIAVFEQYEEGGLLEEAQRIEKTMTEGLKKLQEKFPQIAEVRGKGAMLAIEFLDPETKEPLADIVKPVIQYAGQHGVLLLDAGIFGNVIRFLPSLKVTDELIADALSVIEEALTEVVR